MSGLPAHAIDGDGERTFALVAGLGDPKEAWARVVPLLVAAGARVVIVDNPGVGNAADAGPRSSTQAMAREVAQTIEAVSPGPVHLVGHSMGGMIAQEIALARPAMAASLALCCTYAHAGAYCSRLVASWRAVARELGVPEARRQILPWAFTPEFFADHADDIEAIDGILDEASPSRGVFLGQLDALDAHDTRGRLSAIAAATTVISAERDILVPADRTDALLAEVPGAERRVVPGGHGCFWERSEPFAAALLRAADAVS
ncbi:MAG: alpha/beta fold hydrolase [Miltoncostaeaceae bacterium]